MGKYELVFSTKYLLNFVDAAAYLVFVVGSDFWIDESFRLEASLEHVHAVNLAPLKKDIVHKYDG